jgi:hypothetical protein
MYKASLYEQLEDAANEWLKKDRVRKLREYKSKQLLEVLDITFNPNIKFLLPKHANITYTPSDDRKASMVHRFKQEVRKLKNFLNTGPYPHMDPERRTQLFVRVLETIWDRDALLLMSIKDKKLPFGNITQELVLEAFPQFKDKWGIKSK